MSKNIGPVFPEGTVVCDTPPGQDTVCYSTEEIHGFLTGIAKKAQPIQQTKQEHSRSFKS